MIQSWLPVYQNRVNDAISRYFAKKYSDPVDTIESEFIDALRHAVEWGGKRLRPILAMIAYEEKTWCICPDEIIDSLIGIEFMHCYTLVHDDLPCMDNDTIRRGKPTVWVQYGETMAVLVGDALQTMAFEQIAMLGNIDVVIEFAQSLGNKWVVLWQIRDTLDKQDTYRVDDIIRLHDEKTGWFIASCLMIGGLISGATQWELNQFQQFGILLGRAFQVRDDILDIEGDSVTIGKTVGKDIDQKKWLISLLGLEATKNLLQSISVDLDSCLKNWDNEKFQEVKEYVVNRES